MTSAALPDASGRFGEFGGRYAPETLMGALSELEGAFASAWSDDEFVAEYRRLLHDFVGRPSPLYQATRLSEELGMRILLKREDLNHTGAHKINNTIGQGLLAVRMGKPRIIAETGAGQHGVASATAAAALGLECRVYMGAKDMERQALNVIRMELLGTEVVPVTSGAGTLKDAVSEAMRDWVGSVEATHYIIGSVVGPHPFPLMVREFQKIIGEETRRQLGDVQAAGEGIASGKHGASLGFGTPGVLHGSRTLMLQDDQGQVHEAHSISAGLDYPGVGPEHAHYKEAGLARYESVTDEEAVAAFHLLCRTEGIIPALESAHAIAWLQREAAALAGKTVVVNLSGRGDKDVQEIMALIREPGL